jgi:site-specific DNA-cytosine methylase
LKKDFLRNDTKRQADQRVFNINFPCPTITRAGFVSIYDGTGVRKLSVPELKNIQGFENDMDFGDLSNTQIKSQLGNTMEVMTMKSLMGEIVRIDKLHLQQLQKVEVQDELVAA